MQEGPTPAFSVEHADDAVVLGGEIDIAAVDSLRAALDTAASGAAPLIIDLRDVSFIDSSGIEALCAVRRDAERTGGTVVLRAPSAAVTRVLEITGLHDLFRIEHQPSGGSSR